MNIALTIFLSLLLQTNVTWQIVQMVGNEETELTDDIIEAMLNLMKAHSTQCKPNIGYLTPAEITLYTANPQLYIRKIPLNRDCLLIHPLTGHWVTSIYRANTGTVYVYDSMHTESHFNEIHKHISVLYGKDLASSHQYVPVQQQNYQPICGPMALAFATSLYFGTDPATKLYDLPKLRKTHTDMYL